MSSMAHGRHRFQSPLQTGEVRTGNTRMALNEKGGNIFTDYLLIWKRF